MKQNCRQADLVVSNGYLHVWLEVFRACVAKKMLAMPGTLYSTCDQFCLQTESNWTQ